MSVRRLAAEQPDSFAFSQENLRWAEAEVAKYPPGRGRSAVISLLWRAQKQNDNWLSEPAIRAVAQLLSISYIRALEIATFYSMFNLAPVGKYFVQLCGTTPCMLCGSGKIRRICEQRIGPSGVVRGDGLFSWSEVECLGACSNAPMAQINDVYVEDLTPENFNRLLDGLESGKPLPQGSLSGRKCSQPTLGAGEGEHPPRATLVDESLYDGSQVGAWRASPHWRKVIADGLVKVSGAAAAGAGKQPTSKKSARAVRAATPAKAASKKATKPSKTGGKGKSK